MTNEVAKVTQQILDGTLVLPNRDVFVTKFGEELTPLIERMFNGLWNNYLGDGVGKSNSTYWYKQFPNRTVFNSVVKFLSVNKWVISDVYPSRNWADIRINEAKLLTFVTSQQLSDTRASKKYSKYKMGLKESTRSDLVRINGQTKQTGIIREGFMASANTQFYYDTAKLSEYLPQVISNTVKGMTKVRERHPDMSSDTASYDSVACEIVTEICKNPAMFSQLGNKSDYRGRAIKDSLSKVANPIGYKDFRALLTIPEDVRNVATFRGVYAVYLFIAELQGYKSGPSPAHKAKFGRKMYNSRTLPTLDLTLEHDRKELHELIWLERVYVELDEYFANQLERKLSIELGAPLPTPFMWSVPLECDASSSMLQYEGCLLNDDRLLRMTNVIGRAITDPWQIDGLTREQVKKACTPMLYGSNQPVTTLWKKNNVSYSLEDVAIIHKELRTGAYSLADAFKRFIIQYVQPTEVMTPVIGSEEFTIECNHYKNVAEKMYLYEVYDTASNSNLRFIHMDTHKVADLGRFKTSSVTLLVHNLDSQVADDVSGYIYDKYGFCLDIHDAFIQCPEACLATRKRYAQNLTSIRANRKSILNNYFKSIGIGFEAKQAWDDLMLKVVEADDLPVSLLALK